MDCEVGEVLLSNLAQQPNCEKDHLMIAKDVLLLVWFMVHFANRLEFDFTRQCYKFVVHTLCQEKTSLYLAALYLSQTRRLHHE